MTEFAIDNQPELSGEIGTDLRALRKSKGMTLSELALKIGRSVGYLSQVERDMSDISINDLKRLATALDVPLGWFFVSEDAPSDERAHVVRADSRRKLGSLEDGLVEELLSPDLGGSFEVFRSVFEPGAVLAESVLRETEEAGYIVSGTLELSIGEQTFTLNEGDSFRFAGEPYRWRNPGDEKAVVIWVISPPVY